MNLRTALSTSGAEVTNTWGSASVEVAVGVSSTAVVEGEVEHAEAKVNTSRRNKLKPFFKGHSINMVL